MSGKTEKRLRLENQHLQAQHAGMHHVNFLNQHAKAMAYLYSIAVEGVIDDIKRLRLRSAIKTLRLHQQRMKWAMELMTGLGQ